MTRIDVTSIDPATFEVTVHGRTTTTHRVTADPAYVARLTAGTATADTLIRRSFEFLLAREPNTSILRQFDLPVIGHYFPDFEREIGKLL